jgi:hypothetical protein
METTVEKTTKPNLEKKDTSKGRSKFKKNNKKSTIVRLSKIKYEEKIVQVKRVTKVVKGGKKMTFRAVVIIGDNKHKVELKTNDFNYYLVGNKFTKEFFTYYLREHLKNNDEIKDDDKFSIKIIDHDVNTVELDFTHQNESILLGKNGYNKS